MIYLKKIVHKCFLYGYGAYFNSWVHFNSRKAAIKAFEVFCTPRKGKVQTTQKTFLNEAKDTILKVELVELQTYKWFGNNDTILLVHGWESNVFRWHRLIEKLKSEKYNIIAFDAPAHGNSTGTVLNGPLYAKAIQRLVEKYQPKYVIGHSFGGMALIYNEYLHKNSCVERMITLGSPSELADFMKQYKSILGLSTKMMNAIELHFTELFDLKFSDFSSATFAKEITKKGLLIHDELDAIAPYWASKQVHANWKNSTLITTSGFGHSLHQDSVRNDILNFLKS